MSRLLAAAASLLVSLTLLAGGLGAADAASRAGKCPSFQVPPVSVALLCTEQEFEEHTFVDTVITNVSGAPIAGYAMVVALYDAKGGLLASQRVERKARDGMLQPGDSQPERFIVVHVRPGDVGSVEFSPLPQ